jgi:tRNA (guanine-N7-)-methyltransferase
MKINKFTAPMLITATGGQDQKIIPGQVRLFFSQPNHPLYVDLGAGGGQFLTRASQKYPHINWIGIEKDLYFLQKALKKRKITPTSNIRYIWMYVEQLRQVFGKGEVDRFYLNFNTPWEGSWASRFNVKKRLTYRSFLKVYKDLLSPDGDLLFKTDVPELYEFALTEFKEMGWEILENSCDLHQSQWNQENIITEWEEIATTQGCRIHHIRAKPIT